MLRINPVEESKSSLFVIRHSPFVIPLVYCRLESGQSRRSMIWSRLILRRRTGRASDGSEATLTCTALLAVAVRVLATAWMMYEPGGAGLP